MKKLKLSAIVVPAVFAALCSGNVLQAHPTGAPLLTFPVVPCRVLDTRVSLGPLPHSTAMEVHVRGSQLLASEGAARADCGIPPAAEAVIVNVVVVSPVGTGHLKVNDYIHQAHSVFSRLNYRNGENDSNELVVDLCNSFLYPAPHEPCGFDGARYTDFQILNIGTTTTASTHIVADVVGYLARMPE